MASTGQVPLLGVGGVPDGKAAGQGQKHGPGAFSGGRVARSEHRFLSLSGHCSSPVASQVAFIGYKDFDEPGHLLSCPFGSMADVRSLLASLEASGGGDIAEDVGGGLQLADGLAWSAPLKVLVHFLDAPPHGEEHHELDKEEAFCDDPDGFDRCHK